MKKKRLYCCLLREIADNPILKVMKLTFFLMFFVVLTASAHIDAMSQKVNLDFKNADLSTVLKSLESQTGHIVIYSADKVQADQIHVTVQVKEVELAQALDVLLKGLPYKYVIEGKNILIIPVPQQAVSQAQQTRQKTIKGRVVDENNAPLIGATVVVKGTTQGVATDVNGQFSIKVPESVTTLEVSFVGYKKVEVLLGKRTEVNVKLEPDSQVMEDVVVTGYQTISKERATGAYSTINIEKLEQKPTPNISSALNGLVPGLTIQTSPVEGTTRFMIRGQGTLQESQADRDPLIVVDGFPISGYSGNNDPFATINPNDVESITVLKDAAATSIYGARAANGVIVITTKKGKAGNKLEITADAYWAISSRVDLDYLYNMASAENQFRFEELMHKYDPINLSYYDPYTVPAWRITYMSAPYSMLYERDSKAHITADEYETKKQELIGYAHRKLWKKDLNEYIFRHRTHNQYNLALRGTSEKMNYAFSTSYDDEKGYLKGDESQRIMLNMFTGVKLMRNLTFDVTLNTIFAKEQNNGIIFQDISPWTRLVDDQGEFVHFPTFSTVYEPILLSEYEGKTPASWLYNPVSDMQYRDNDAQTMTYRVQGGFEYATAWGLTLSAKGQYEWRRYTNHVSYDPESFYVRDFYNTYSTFNEETGNYISYFPAGGVYTDNGDTYESYNLRGQVDYNFTSDVHVVTVLAGTEVLSSSLETVPSITRYGYNKYTNSVLTTPDYVSYNNDIFGTPMRMPFQALGALSNIEDRFFSVYANASYTYANRYSLTASFRTDASNFQSKKSREKFSPFWSIGASWLLSRESFMSGISWIDQLKVRASYGIAGVAAGKSGTSSVTTLEVWSGFPQYTNNESFNTIATRGNETLTWEKSRTLNIGLDIAMFNHKLFGSIEFYDKFSYDVLSSATVPVISQGTNKATFNNAEMLNRGIEFSLGSDLRIVGDLKWKGTLNYAYNHNEVKKYDLKTSIPAFNPGYVEGYPVDLHFILKPAGYTSEGFILLQGKDGTQEAIVDRASSHSLEQIARQDGETVNDNNWVYYLGSATPTSNLSFSNQFSWKGLTLSFMITGRFGYYVRPNDAFYDTNSSHYSKQLDEAFKVYDEGYANQTSYSAFPLYNDANYETYKGGYGYMYAYNASRNFRSSFIKGDHVRLNEVYIGYELPERWLSRQSVFRRVNIYAQASNLGILWSANKDMDPDYPVGNVKPMPTFTFGLKIGFKNW
ncbi:SusC/RagA family TonB-linked outer membrane protein [Butyricimonas virosa]|uniref:SusC/RagA family TonB-linked outer membrane protein n=1 Tax=Butyricimonas virosa TaxID=544645 RepID=UPI00242EC15B|nr:SusC/RagA family TonB-linked outer membrane protein [Butyricimonas virosa]